MRFELSKYVKSVRGKRILGWDSFSDLRDNNFWDAIKNSGAIEISLENIDIYSHDGVIWLTFIFLYRSRRNLHTYVLLPEDERKINYLKYIGFHELQEVLKFSFLNEYLLHMYSPRYKAKSDYMKSTRKLQLVNGNNWSKIAHTTIHDIREYLIENLGFSATDDRAYELVYPFITTMQELLHNIALHGGSRGGSGVGFISFTPLPKKLRMVRYCFSDVGNGFLATLRDKHSITCKSDAEAIFKALLFRYTTPADGILGLYPTLNFIRRRKGSIHIRSGNAKVVLNFNSTNNLDSFDKYYDKPSPEWLKSLSSVSHSTSVPGTHILVNLSI